MIRDLLAQFGLESLPVCDEGMLMLKAFAEQSPKLSAAQCLGDAAAYTPFGRDPLWRTFSTHWAACSRCKER